MDIPSACQSEDLIVKRSSLCSAGSNNNNNNNNNKSLPFVLYSNVYDLFSLKHVMIIDTIRLGKLLLFTVSVTFGFLRQVRGHKNARKP